MIKISKNHSFPEVVNCVRMAVDKYVDMSQVIKSVIFIVNKVCYLKTEFQRHAIVF